MKNKPTKVRPPRVYRTKTGRPYIKHKGKRVYLNFGKKTNDMSNISILKLFLKYLRTKKRDVKNKPTKAQVIYPDTDRIELENRQRVDSQVRNYLRDKYEKINEMDKAEEKKRKEAKERAEEKKKDDEAKARQELKDAAERQRDIDRAIDRERNLQAELKADRAVSRTVLRQLTASNDRIERLIEEGKNIARDAVRDVKEQAIVEAIPVEEPPRRARRPRIGAAHRRERKRVERKADRKVRDLGDIVVEDITAAEDAKRAQDELRRVKEESGKLTAEAKRLKRDGIIEAMFSGPISAGNKNKATPDTLIKNLKLLGYDVKDVKPTGTRVNKKMTIIRFLKDNENFDLGDTEKTGWNNLLNQLTKELLNYAAEEEIRAIMEEEREREEKERAKPEEEKEPPKSKEPSKKKESSKKKEKSKHEAKQEVEDTPKLPSEENISDDASDEVVEVVEQEGVGVRGACIELIGKLKVGDIKKFLKKTHTDAYRKKYRHKGKLLKFNYIEALILAMKDEKIRSAVCSKLTRREGSLQPSKLNPQVGGGADPLQGLTTTQIDGLMSDEKRYLGTVASDEIKTLKPKGTKYAFIMNTDKASKPGQHWIAVYISGKDDKTVEVYDPLGTYEPTKEFLEQIKTLVDKMKLDHYLLLKVNKIKNQSDTSDTCGWFAVKFLKERFLGNRFKFSTGFTQLKEDEIQKYKKQNGYGFDTFL